MDLLWLYDIPTWMLGLLIVATFVALSVAGLLATRRWARRFAGSGNDLTNYFVSAVGVFYALLVGLIAVATWERYSSVENVVSLEAASVGNLYRDAEGYPEVDRERLQEALRRYVHIVIEKEWPAQRRGEASRAGTGHVSALSRSWIHLDPVTEGQKIAHAQALTELNEFLGYRRMRRQAVGQGLPPVMWTVMLLGGALCVGLTFLFWSESRALHALLTGALGATVGLVIFLIVAMDHPMQGEFSVPPADFEQLLRTVMRPQVETSPLAEKR